MNIVIAGDYKNCLVSAPLMGKLTINAGIGKSPVISKANVESYQIEPTCTKKGKHHIPLQFKDGKRSLLEVDDKVFNAITVALF